MAAHASILAWIILWTEELGRLQSMGSQRVRHNLMTKTFFFFFLKSLSRVRLFVTPWTVAHQASPSMGFSRQEYWSGLPFPSPMTNTFSFTCST